MAKIAGGTAVVILLLSILWSQRGFIHTNAGAGKQAEQIGKDGLGQRVEAGPTDTPETTKVSDNQIKPVSQTIGTPEVGTPQTSSTPKEPASKAVKMPKVNGLKRAEAVRRLKKKGLRYKIVIRNSSEVSVGIVIRASVSAGKTVKKGRQVILYVSKGRKIVVTPKPTVTPRPTVPKKPNHKQDDNLAGDLDTILY